MIKKFIAILIFAAMLLQTTVSAAVIVIDPNKPVITEPSITLPSGKKMKVSEFVKLSPKQFEKATGKKLNLMQKMGLKVAQKKMSKADTKISKGLYILLAFLGLGWLAMGILDDWSGSDWIVSLVLYLLFWLPGFIYTLVKMKKYYN